MWARRTLAAYVFKWPLGYGSCRTTPSALRAQRIGFVFQQSHSAVGVPVVDAVADGLLYSGVPMCSDPACPNSGQL